MPIRAISAPNIALIKYWGNRDEELRLPAADSLSMTLDQPTVEVVIDHAEQFCARSFDPDGTERTLTDKERGRLEKHFLLTKEYLHRLGIAEIFPSSVSLEIRSKVPRGIGLASSAAVFSALAESYAAGSGAPLSRRDISIIARLGSGSASRSVFGGFVAMIAGEGNEIASSYAQEIEPQDHWALRDIIIAPSLKEKETGSSEGHMLAHTSPIFETRLRKIQKRQQMCIEAIEQKDFEKLQKVAEEDCLDMHAVMASSRPPLQYLTKNTKRIVAEIEALRAREHVNVLCTIDAGPTVHLICEESALQTIRAYAKAQRCAVFEAGIGKGSHVL